MGTSDIDKQQLAVCIQLQARSQEARSNWEAALASKDRAILQLEEALASRQRAVEQLVAAASHTADLELDYQEKSARVLKDSMHAALKHAQLLWHAFNLAIYGSMLLSIQRST